MWNGRWTRQLLQDLLPDSPVTFVPPRDYKVTLTWLQRITATLQQTQRALYRTRRLEILSKDRKARNVQVISLRRKRRSQRTQTLYAAWRLPYIKPSNPRRIPLARPPPIQTPSAPPTTLPLRQWVQYSTVLSRRANPAIPHSHGPHKPPKFPKRETHRTTKLKLRKLRNVILLSQ